MSTVHVPTARAASTTARRAGTVVGAAVAALAVWVLTGPVAGIDLAVSLGNTVRPVGPVDVAGTALLAGLAGWGLLALLERTSARPGRVWTVTATLVLAVSLTGPLAGTDLSSTLTLAAMHLVTGAVLIPLLSIGAAIPESSRGQS